jgi:hypothetical protein
MRDRPGLHARAARFACATGQVCISDQRERLRPAPTVINMPQAFPPGVGHTVLLARVPAVDRVVAAFLEAFPDPARPGGPTGRADPYAHVTVLGPFVPRADVTAELVAELTALVKDLLPVTVSFTRVRRWEDGLVWLEPDQPAVFQELTARVHGRWPEHPPYSGLFDEVIPHLSLGRSNAYPTAGDYLGPIEHLMPISTSFDGLELIYWEDSLIELIGETGTTS